MTDHNATHHKVDETIVKKINEVMNNDELKVNENDDKPQKKYTAKRLKHLERQAKKMKHLRTQEEITRDCNKIREELEKTGLPHSISNIVKFRRILSEFEKNHAPVQGSLPLHGFGYDLIYSLTMDKRHSNFGAKLQANKDLK